MRPRNDRNAIMENLDKYRKIYLKSEVPTKLKTEGWNQIRTEIAGQTFYQFRPGCLTNLSGAALAAIAVLFILVVGIAQAAQPGQPLYPIKSLTKQVVTTIQDQIQPKFQKINQEKFDLSNPIYSPNAKQTPKTKNNENPNPTEKSENQNKDSENHDQKSDDVKGLSTEPGNQQKADDSHGNSQNDHQDNPNQKDDESHGHGGK
jgi:hypothetical protein